MRAVALPLLRQLRRLPLVGIPLAEIVNLQQKLV